MEDKSRWQKEFDALPEWTQKLVRSVSRCESYGGGSPFVPISDPEKWFTFNLTMRKEAHDDWWDGFWEMRDLAAAITAPWPPPSDLPPHENMTTGNIVEMMTAGDDDCAFDQPCYFGHRVESHAVYCHNEAWPDSPRKCRRSQHDPAHRHEDCPGFVANKIANQ